MLQASEMELRSASSVTLVPMAAAISHPQPDEQDHHKTGNDRQEGENRFLKSSHRFFSALVCGTRFTRREDYSRT
jgi:hypothetical protein